MNQLIQTEVSHRKSEGTLTTLATSISVELADSGAEDEFLVDMCKLFSRCE
jgi:hypothetical protein